MATADERLAQRLNELCDICHENRPNSGYDICEQCYQSTFLGRHRCIGCNSYVTNAYSCTICSTNVPPENADYEVLMRWLESRKVKKARSPLSPPISQMPRRVATNIDTHSSCTICLDGFNIEDELVTTPCLHVYHTACLVPWLSESDTCPTCITKVL